MKSYVPPTSSSSFSQSIDKGSEDNCAYNATWQSCIWKTWFWQPQPKCAHSDTFTVNCDLSILTSRGRNIPTFSLPTFLTPYVKVNHTHCLKDTRQTSAGYICMIVLKQEVQENGRVLNWDKSKVPFIISTNHTLHYSPWSPPASLQFQFCAILDTNLNL